MSLLAKNTLYCKEDRYFYDGNDEAIHAELFA